MGDLEGWKGNLSEECPPSAHPVCVAIDPCIELWRKAELRTNDLISHIQPTIDSEKQRNAVVEYVQRLVRQRIGCDVFAFGSVPLKTYLPDGDIDLTAFSKQHDVNNSWASDVRSALQEEEQRVDVEFRVKDVQYIHAEVQLVKCFIENIVVDISFNQIGGICTLCFLEEVNELIGKDNLFKRSIILVKAWCYYEARILGAHHGLISTYALETLVLYIFHIFHATVRGPLEVLFKFLDFFSKFDWDNYCLSIHGPVPKWALPEIAAESPQTNGGNVLLSKEFLKVCSENYCAKGQNNHIQTFSAKHLNIVDPLRENNNLGRSVSQANFHRIRSALGYGAQTLENILQSSEENISGELDRFFMNIRKRHDSVRRPDVLDDNSTIANDLPLLENCTEHMTEENIEQCSENYVSAFNQFNENCNNIASPPLEDLISGDRLTCNFQKLACDKYSGSLAGPHQHLNPFGEATSESQNPHSAIQVVNSFDSNVSNTGSNYSNSSVECGLLENGLDNLLCSADDGNVSPSQDIETSSFLPTSFVEEELTLGTRDIPQKFVDGSVVQTHSIPSYPKQNADHASTFQGSHRPPLLGKQASSFALLSNHSASSPSLESMSVGVVDGLSCSKSDILNGDYRHHLNILAYGRSCQDHVLPGSLLPFPVVPRHAQEHCLWKGPGRPVHPNLCMPNHVSGRGVISSHPRHYPSAYPGADSRIQSGTYNIEEITKARSGTGTYFPKSYRSNREKHSLNKGRHQYGIPASDFPAMEVDGYHSSRRYVSYDSVPSLELGYSNSDENYGIGGLSRPESVYKTSYQSASQAVMGNSVFVSPAGGMALAMHPPPYLSGQDAFPSFAKVNTSGPTFFMAYNGKPFPSDHVQFGTFGPVPFCTVPCVKPEPGGSTKESGLQQTAAPLKQDRLTSRNYQLKEEDFPPLSFQGTDRGDFSATGSEHNSN